MNEKSFWRRRRTWIVIAIALLPFMSVFLVTRSFLLSPLIGSSLRNVLGTDVMVRGAQWNWDGTVFMDEVVLHAEGIEGVAADVVSIHDVTIELKSSVLEFLYFYLEEIHFFHEHERRLLEPEYNQISIL